MNGRGLGDGGPSASGSGDLGNSEWARSERERAGLRRWGPPGHDHAGVRRIRLRLGASRSRVARLLPASCMVIAILLAQALPLGAEPPLDPNHALLPQQSDSQCSTEPNLIFLLTLPSISIDLDLFLYIFFHDTATTASTDDGHCLDTIELFYPLWEFRPSVFPEVPVELERLD
jgi:hypothetical protein